jgi:Fe-S cluster biogenesis protein NfuA
MNIVRIEPTPNPNALKFIVDQPLLDVGSRSYTHQEAASEDPLAAKLFGIPEMESVFYMSNFVTVSKTNLGNWDAIVDQVRTILNEHMPETVAQSNLQDNAEAASTEEAILLEKISYILDKKVRPALAGDGGGLELLGLNGYTLRVRYHGACGSCPSSTAGTLRAIGNLLKNEVDERLVVVPG